MNATRNTLPTVVRKNAVRILNDTVANLFDLYLYARIKQAHWNLGGRAFIGLHKLLGEFATTVQEHVDAAAKRATALGGVVEGTLRESVKNYHLKKKEEPAAKSGPRDWIRKLADIHAASGDHVRSTLKQVADPDDCGAAEKLTDVLRDLDRQLRILEAHLDQKWLP